MLGRNFPCHKVASGGTGGDSCLPHVGSNGHAFKGLAQSVWKSKTTERDGRIASNQKLLERLEAENTQLRENVVELALQIQALRDRTRTLTA